MTDQLRVASWNLHHWEEPVISGTRGSGTIFFSGCTGRCLFCQNYPISQLGHGDPASNERLAGMMLELQRKGAHNINLVTPTHQGPLLFEGVQLARARTHGVCVMGLRNSHHLGRVGHWAEQATAAGLVSSVDKPIKVLGDGELTAPLTVRVHRLSKSAKEKITAAGGTFEEMWGEPAAGDAEDASETKQG